MREAQGFVAPKVTMAVFVPFVLTEEVVDDRLFALMGVVLDDLKVVKTLPSVSLGVSALTTMPLLPPPVYYIVGHLAETRSPPLLLLLLPPKSQRKPPSVALVETHAGTVDNPRTPLAQKKELMQADVADSRLQK